MESSPHDPTSLHGTVEKFPTSGNDSSITQFDRRRKDLRASDRKIARGEGSVDESDLYAPATSSPSDEIERPRWYDAVFIGVFGIASCGIMILGFWKLYELLS
jgi:hypothetical protein